MLSAEDFFAVCTGQWQTDRVCHYPLRGEVERSHTKFNAETLTFVEKHQISSSFIPREFFKSADAIEHSYGFVIAFDTKSERREE
jgi:CpeS-like protein